MQMTIPLTGRQDMHTLSGPIRQRHSTSVSDKVDCLLYIILEGTP